MSIDLGIVPSSWRTATINPAPKRAPIDGTGDLRPIFFTPILSRMMERLVVRNHIFPASPLSSVMGNKVLSLQTVTYSR